MQPGTAFAGLGTKPGPHPRVHCPGQGPQLRLQVGPRACEDLERTPPPVATNSRATQEISGYGLLDHFLEMDTYTHVPDSPLGHT